jgi:hypothetical protein
MGKKALLAAALLLTTALDAGAADTAPLEPDFIIEEFVHDISGPIATHHYRPVADSPFLVPLEGWNCEAWAPSAGNPAAWGCVPKDSTGGYVAAIGCGAGEHASMAIASGTPLKRYEVSIDWRR